MKKGGIVLALICVLGLFLRLQNINWDSGFHLHPDERFLTMVGNSMKLPGSFAQYLDHTVSSFNPVNVGYEFFVYGVFPIVLNKLLAYLFNSDTYELFTLQGRLLSTIFDMGVVFFIYRATVLMEAKYGTPRALKYWAVFLYCISVLPIQLSHFFATDTFLNFFMFAGCFFAFRHFLAPNYKDVAVSALFLGLGIATKANAVYIIPLYLFFLLYASVKTRRLRDMGMILFVFGSVLYMAVRIGEPYYFESPDLFNPTPNKAFLRNIATLKSFEGKEVMYPPSIQWINTKPVLFSLLNLILFGLGLLQSVLTCFGLFLVLRFVFQGKTIRKSNSGRLEAGVVLFWVIALFIFQSIQFTKVLRYFIYLYPFFALAGGAGAVAFVGMFTRRFIRYGIIGLLLVWPVLFNSIYVTDHTRVQASRWINENAKSGSVIATEYWDDPLPLYTAPDKQYRIEQLPVFDPDTQDKWRRVETILGNSDYYVLSSNRGWGSIPSVPERYPRMSAYYESLFAGKTKFEKVASFYPAYYPCRLLGFNCPRMLSSWIDESFTVYDHPTVHIFRSR